MVGKLWLQRAMGRDVYLMAQLKDQKERNVTD